MLFFFYTLPSSFLCFLIVFLFLLLLPNWPSFTYSPRAAKLDWAQRLSCPNSMVVWEGRAGSKNELGNQREADGFCVRLCVARRGKYNCHIAADWATSCRIRREIMYSYTEMWGEITQREKNRGREEKIESERRTRENLGVKVLMAGVFECVWQGSVKERKCGRMFHFGFITVIFVQENCVFVLISLPDMSILWVAIAQQSHGHKKQPTK